MIQMNVHLNLCTLKLMFREYLLELKKNVLGFRMSVPEESDLMMYFYPRG